jgi:hypothetical protein
MLLKPSMWVEKAGVHAVAQKVGPWVSRGAVPVCCLSPGLFGQRGAYHVACRTVLMRFSCGIA